MNELLPKIKISVHPNIFVKDPDSSDLGKKILSGSVNLIDSMGIENFTFRKLGKDIGATEAAIYRYFESKHKLLLYLTSWYWAWLEYKLVFGLSNIESAEERLERAINILTEGDTMEFQHPYMDISKLSHVIITESSKTYLTADVDQENKEGVFEGYKQLVKRICSIILEINPQYPYPRMLVSTVIEGAHQQRFFSEHIPALTDQKQETDEIPAFYIDLVKKAIHKN